MRLSLSLVAAAAAFCAFAAPARADVDKPAALVADGIPAIPDRLAEATRPYMEFRTAGFEGWNPRTHGIAITTRFGNTAQVHVVGAPMAMRRQVTFEADPIARGGYARGRGDVLVVQKDVGGSEFWQLYRVDKGRLVLLTDGKSRNSMDAFTNIPTAGKIAMKFGSPEDGDSESSSSDDEEATNSLSLDRLIGVELLSEDDDVSDSRHPL